MNPNRFTRPLISIRPLSVADAAVYRALRLRGLREHADAFTSSFDEVNAQPLSASEKRLAPGSGEILWGAFVDGTLAGTLGLNRETREKSRHKATLVAMFVAAEHAGRGIGRALVDVVIDHARHIGVELLVLTVTDNNDGARALYERAGFQNIGVEPDAIRVAGVSYGKRHMALQLPPLSAR